MKTNRVLFTIVAAGLCLMAARADERRFTYTYEPETMPAGGREFEQWVTLRTQRTKDGEVQQQNYNKWEFREELEFGITDRYSVSAYLNTEAESYHDVSTDDHYSKFKFTGISLENRYMLLNPAAHPIGLTLYLEPRYSGEEAEVEEKIIIGQRHGDWKWALNLTHATEWDDNFHETEGEFELTFGVSYDFAKRWSVGLELRDHNELPDYAVWENTAVFLGPVLSYRQEKWWAALTILPQIYGANFSGDPDSHHQLELEGHERVNIRFILGVSF